MSEFKYVPVLATRDMVREAMRFIRHMPTVSHDRLEVAINAAIAAAPTQPSPAEPLAWIYEDELPDDYPYGDMFPYSKVDMVRMFPVYGPPSELQDRDNIRNSTLLEAYSLLSGMAYDKDGFCIDSDLQDAAAKILALQSQPSPAESDKEAVRNEFRAYAKGWIACAKWAKREDLISDQGSPAYIRDRDDALKSQPDKQKNAPDWVGPAKLEDAAPDWSGPHIGDPPKTELLKSQPAQPIPPGE